MIGQTNLHSCIEQLIENGTFPRFSILVGPKGSGKKTLANWIRRCMGRNKMTLSYEATDVKIDTIREIIQRSYKVVNPTIYIIPDADNMSNAAKNALLKVTEEPPNNAYFIMTLEDENNTLETIRSRGTVFHMDRYTPDEILEYSKNVFGIEKLDGSTRQKIIDLCETPGDVNILNKCGLYEFYDYVQLVVDNIAEVGLANAFKIPSKVALKEDSEGYDLRLFWKAFASIMMERAKDTYFDNRPNKAIPYLSSYNATKRCIQSLNTKGINRQMLIDTWILEIRRIFGVM